MKVIALQDGIAFVLTPGDQQKVVQAAAGTDFTPRDLLEALADTLSANLEQDLNDVVTDLEEQAEFAATDDDPNGGDGQDD